MKQKMKWKKSPKGIVGCVNVYLEDRYYGGPEEGGWYYTGGEIQECALVTRSNSLDVLSKLELEYSNDGRPSISSVLSRGRYVIKFEPRPGRNYPRYTPYYE